MKDSILDSIKQYVGIDKSIDDFDEDILMNINVVFSVLYQVGVDALKGVTIEGSDEEWSDVFSESPDLINMCKSYTQLKVRITFDPPTNSFVMDSLKKTADELEWRIRLQAEGGFEEDE